LSSASVVCTVGGAMVAMVKSRSVIAGRTPAGSFTMLIWMLSPISRPSTSTMMACGMSPARQTTSMSWRTTLTPPRLMPGDRPSFLKFTGTCTRTRDLSVTRMKSTWDRQIGDRIEMHVARQHARLPGLEVEEGGGSRPCASSRSSSRGSSEIRVGVDLAP
jgi:hypothetical protein